ncbi:L-serine ammonia-lyase [Corynebacterium choanae]|uniref:L-serine ammonia-lyase n=1 Tax=Corynebacterium choanae TaxID=1862358 RepID=A0A3G6J7A3_9CORY|nr:L-serine ammonia-lyase [Corynebacterium choanae]AZA13995.1 L-serine dehydratase 2 [Corynebacterium choanae]
MTISVFDLMRIGIGPSSSHTVGPMRAGLAFANHLHSILSQSRDAVGPLDPSTPKAAHEGDTPDLLRPQSDSAVAGKVAGAVSRQVGITVILYGSLAATGVGHGTLGAVLAGLDGIDPATCDPDDYEQRLESIQATRQIFLAGDASCPVTCGFEDIILRPFVVRTVHTNAVTFSALLADGREISETYYSIGGGFIRTAAEVPTDHCLTGDWLYSSGAELVARAEQAGVSIAEIQRRCELSLRDEQRINSELDNLVAAMEQCTRRGLQKEGILPGGLMVRRRAPQFYQQLVAEDPNITPEFSEDWVNLVALAVNEENAAGGRVVTAPTNGAAGIVPAVGFYVRYFTPAGRNNPQAALRQYLLACGAIGSLYKERASISGAEVGCQGEVGSAASMAAGGLADVLGGSPKQVANAAEIAMEHSLGLTCDPIGGLVQVPCIERNAISAGKAINAARLALRGDGSHRVSLDEVIETMKRTGMDMSDRYKETAGGGLATTVGAITVNVPEC